MNIIFFGNTKYSVIDAQALHDAFKLTAVVTIPDKQIKKNKILQSPVKLFALQHDIPVIEASKLTREIIEEIKQRKPDFLVVADYGLILPQALLDIPTYAPLNVHHSLLPKYRGPSPVPAMLLSGDKKTGVTIIWMNDKVDDGDMLAQKEYMVKPDDTSDSVLTRLNELGGQTVVEVIRDFKQIKPRKQDLSQATYTSHMSKEDGYVDSNNPPSLEKLDRMIRAYYPWPGVWTKFRIKNVELRIKFLPKKSGSSVSFPRLSTLSSRPKGKRESIKGNLDPRLHEDDKKGIFLIQVEGKKPQTIKDFLNGYPEAKQWIDTLLRN